MRGKFVFNERKGQTLTFDWTPKYLGAPSQQWSFVDEEIKEIPRGLMEHLQQSGKLPILENVLIGKHRRGTRVTSYKNRYDFYEMTGDIITSLPSQRKIVEIEGF